MKPTSEILGRIYESSGRNRKCVFTRLYRYLLREDIYMTAYKNLYANEGAGTKGTDNDTADGFSLEYVQRIIKELKELTYEPKPVRRTYIEKRNGKLRPLGVPSFRDKLVQDAMKQILEAIYEPIFSEHSHGFRRNRSCHTALKEVSIYFKGVKWFVEGDIKGCFDNINHKVLLNLLSTKIKDSRFINLVRKFLKAGYMENWVYHKTYSGTPQGGILSPILTNIYLNELDAKVAEMAKSFNVSAQHFCSSVYSKKRTYIYKLRRQYGKSTNLAEKKELLKRIHKLEVEKRKLPCKDASDKAIVYVRYADDFLIGIKGTREEAEAVKTELRIFLSEVLKMELSEEKTKITHSSNAAQFLGYEIKVRRNNRTKRTANGIVKRTLNNTVALLIPFDRIEKFMYERKIVKQGINGALIPLHKHQLSGLTEIEILDTYNALTRGLCNYYSMASNFMKLNYFTYLMEYSCLKTLANKHKTRISKLKKKYKIGRTWGITYKTKSGVKTMKIIRHKDLSRSVNYQRSGIDTLIDYTYLGARNSLEARLKANKCELCGAEGDGYRYEIHHVNKLKNLKGKQYWEIAMLSRKRKTIVLCQECHETIHKS